jgi:hypothetical protein
MDQKLFTLVTVTALVALSGCYESRLASINGLVDIRVETYDAEPLPGEGVCEVFTASDPSESRTHLEICSPLEYETTPASSGDHFGVWADFQEYESPVPQGFLVHSMEHGGVVLYYNCPDDCPGLVAALRSIKERFGPDDRCESVPDVLNRIIIAPNPDLDVPFAITAWERVYRATCLHEPSINDFMERHYGRGPEDLCGGGFDGEDRGWCN